MQGRKSDNAESAIKGAIKTTESMRNEAISMVAFRENFLCAYFGDGRKATIECLLADEACSRNFHLFLAEGYRRLGNLFYRNLCEECSACRPLRLESGKFRPSKSQKRTIKKNADIRLEIRCPSVTPEKIRLYKKYLSHKHHEEKEVLDYEIRLLNIHYGYPGTREMDYYFGSKLIGVGIVDEGCDSLSSNYFYYDTDYLGRRLGVYSILSEISFARLVRKKYYYLGFYIGEIPRMSYKKQFRPNQVYENEEWKTFLS
ncbi:MAG TPA: arginyltransferase [Nitrospiraceae bacterium]|nr:arginyltransferase [Nitrospiraceae bacterium]